MDEDFSYLSRPFAQWYDQIFGYYGGHLIPPQDDDYIEIALDEEAAFIESLDLTREQFRQAFFEPYQDLASRNKLSQETIEKLLDFQSKTIGHRQEVLFNDETPLIFKIEISSVNYLNALEWTIVNVLSLRLSGFELINEDYDLSLSSLPFEQCYYCGVKNTDPRQRSFNNKLKYCHAIGCVNSNLPNPEEHKKCCYGQWGNIKKSFIQKLRRYDKKYKPLAKKAFIEFCGTRLKENLKIQNRIQDAPYT